MPENDPVNSLLGKMCPPTTGSPVVPPPVERKRYRGLCITAMVLWFLICIAFSPGCYYELRSLLSVLRQSGPVDGSPLLISGGLLLLSLGLLIPWIELLLSYRAYITQRASQARLVGSIFLAIGFLTFFLASLFSKVVK